MGAAHDIENASSIEVTPSAKAQGNGNGAAYTPRPSKIGNPAPLGLFSFASTTFILSMFNIQTRGIAHPNVVVGMAIFCGGLAQVLAGMWEFPKGNTFGATAFTSYGTFWMSYATILLPVSGIVAAYGTDVAQLQSALGIFLLAWAMFTAILCLASLGKSISFISLFGLLTLTFVVLACGEFGNNLNVTKAGGVIGVIVAFNAYYIGVSDLLASEANPVIRLPLGLIHKKD